MTRREKSTEVRVDRVRKREGQVVPFDVQKIRQAIEAALAATGGPDPGFAREVAAVVELTLHENARRAQARNGGAGPRYVPTIEEIQDLVERALMELGKPEVAKAYILYRDRRTRARAALRVHSSAGPAPGAPRVHAEDGTRPWSKGRLVASLVEEGELPRELADEIAAAVERRVFGSGLTRITRAHIRELVASELFERGLTGAIRSLGVLGLAPRDLEFLLAREPLDPWEDVGTPAEGLAPELEVGRDVLRRYALEHLLPGGIGELHRSGDLHVEDLGAPHLPLVMTLEARLLASGGHSVTSAQAVLDGVARLSGAVSRGLVLERPADVLAPLQRAARPASPLGLSGWLRALAAIARAGRVRVDLGSPGPRAIAFTARLVESLVELVPEPVAPRLFLEGHELEALLEHHPETARAVDRLMGDGRLLTTWGDEDEVFVGPGCRRRRRESGVLSCAGAIALDLPRLARRAGPWREDLVLSGIAELVQAALEIARVLEGFQRASERRTPVPYHARRSWAIVPVGLREALLTLGEGTLDPDLGARLLGLVAEASGRFATGALGALAPVAPSGFFGERAARRFAWLDQERARLEGGEQGFLFEGAALDERSAARALRAYRDDLRLSPAPGVAAGRLEAEALRTLRSGALSLAGLPSLGDWGGGDDETPYLSAWKRFEVLRRARSGEVVLELFPQRAPEADPARSPVPLRPVH